MGVSGRSIEGVPSVCEDRACSATPSTRSALQTKINQLHLVCRCLRTICKQLRCSAIFHRGSVAQLSASFGTQPMCFSDSVRCEIAGELRQQIRAAFEAQKGETDPYAKKFLLSDARAQLKYLRETLLLRN